MRRSPQTDPTVAWMTADVVQRCRDTLDTLAALEPEGGGAARLGDAAALLRGAAADLVALVELVEGPEAADRARADGVGAFNLSFRDASDRVRHPSGSSG